MLTLVTTIPLLVGDAPGDYQADHNVDIFGNFDEVGNVPNNPSWGETAWQEYVWGGEGVDESRALNQAPLPLFPGASLPPSWKESVWGESSWGSSVPRLIHDWGETNWSECGWCATMDDPSVSFETQALHFGEVNIGAKARDNAGNCQGDIAELIGMVVNSTPLPVARLTRSAFAAGQQTFTYVESPQLERDWE